MKTILRVLLTGSMSPIDAASLSSVAASPVTVTALLITPASLWDGT